MKRVYVSDDPLLAGYCRSVLEAHGIVCVAPHEWLRGGAGEIPLTECWPSVWVADDADAYRARRIIEDLFAGERRRERPWRCPRCGELLEPQFGECWRCAGHRS